MAPSFVHLVPHDLPLNGETGCFFFNWIIDTFSLICCHTRRRLRVKNEFYDTGTRNNWSDFCFLVWLWGQLHLMPASTAPPPQKWPKSVCTYVWTCEYTVYMYILRKGCRWRPMKLASLPNQTYTHTHKIITHNWTWCKCHKTHFSTQKVSGRARVDISQYPCTLLIFLYVGERGV